MVPFLSYPLALLGLMSLPVLVGIYLFHRRPRTVVVSSLMLWTTLRRPQGGGRKTEPPRFPITFWLELMILLLLVAAAAAPMLPRAGGKRPLIIILDDSLSMQAGRGEDTARTRARHFLERDVLPVRDRKVRIILAGARPQLAPLDRWTCASTDADIDAALELAAQLPERNAMILVVTDHGPQRKPGPRIRWMAFGAPEENVAFVAAGRRSNRIAAEIQNFGRQQADLVVRVIPSAARNPPRTGDGDSSRSAPLGMTRLTLAPKARRMITFDLPATTGDVDLTLNDDAAAFDNRVTLISDRHPPVRVTIDISNEKFRKDVQRAIEATERAIIVPAGDIMITDRAQPQTAPFVVQFLTATGASHIGPFLLDRTHPLTDGLALDGVIWTAAASKLPGAPIITTGKQPLVTDETLAAGKHHIRFAIDPALSNLQRSTAWPALMWNLIEWRTSLQPGVRNANVVEGAAAEVIVGVDVRDVRVTTPDGRTRVVNVAPGSQVVPIAATEPGVWRVAAGRDTYRFASNALVPSESDLSTRDGGEKSRWGEDALTLGGYENIAPLLLLGALAIAALHQRVTAAESVPA